jgi:poly-gamma-glutamate synthesis protein (capsule biosynthesis protein)
MAPEKPATKTKPIVIALLGDVMLGRGVSEELGLHPPEWFWGTALPILKSADGVIANLECAITRHETPWRRTPKVFHFRAEPEAIDVLRAANVGCVSLANNHSLDFEEAGLADTLAHLDRAGIRHVGAGVNAAAAAKPVLFEVGDLKLGVIAFTDNEPAFAATDRPGTHYRPVRADAATLASFRETIGDLRAGGAQIVILSVHWGPNMVQRPPPQFRKFARALCELGVDLVHGHSAHIFQGVEVRQGRLVLYDTGDFIDDYAVDPELRNDWSFIFTVEADGDGLRRLRLEPVRLSFAQTNLAEGDDAKAICQRMRERCTELGTRTIDIDRGLEVAIRA